MRAVFLLLLLAVSTAASSTDQRSPAQWVEALRSQDYKERERASAALAALGGGAREEVRAALKSDDPEVRHRARELWPRLRWLVVPGADDDVSAFVEAAQAQQVKIDDLRPFVKKHGATALRLIDLLRQETAHPNDFHEPLRAFFEEVPAEEIARVVRGVPQLLALLADVPENGLGAKADAARAAVYHTLGDDRLALSTAREGWLRDRKQNLFEQALAAARGGGVFDDAAHTLRARLAESDNADRTCRELVFHLDLAGALERKEEAVEILEAPRRADIATADAGVIFDLLAVMVRLKLKPRVAELLADVKEPLPLYIRSLVQPDRAEARRDWEAALALIDALPAEKQEERLFALTELMERCTDPRRTHLWEKILAMEPKGSVWDTNACLRLGPLYEGLGETTRAVEIYERALDFSTPGQAAIFLITDPKTGEVKGGDVKEWLRNKIAELKAKAE